MRPHLPRARRESGQAVAEGCHLPPRDNCVGKVLAIRAAFESGLSEGRRRYEGRGGWRVIWINSLAGVGMQARLWLHGRRGAPCDRLLEADVDAATRGVFERLFGLVADVIARETVKGGRERERVVKVRAQVCQGVRVGVRVRVRVRVTQNGTLGWRRLSEVTALPLSPSHILVMPKVV